VTDCARCQILEEELRQLRAELDRRVTVLLPPARELLPTLDDLPHPVGYLCECERVNAFADLDALLPIASQEG
jgi:hypothetical protein